MTSRLGSIVLGMAIAIVLVGLAGATTVETRRLAVLVAAPWEGETAMAQDLAAMADALRQRGFAPRDVVTIEGALTRATLLAFLGTVSQRIASWRGGEVFLALSGHGSYRGTTAADARPALLLSDREPAVDYELPWEEIFATLRAPAGVRLVVLPDT